MLPSCGLSLLKGHLLNLSRQAHVQLFFDCYFHLGAERSRFLLAESSSMFSCFPDTVVFLNAHSAALKKISLEKRGKAMDVTEYYYKTKNSHYQSIYCIALSFLSVEYIGSQHIIRNFLRIYYLVILYLSQNVHFLIHHSSTQ